MVLRPSAWLSGGRPFAGNEPRLQFSAANDGFTIEIPGPGDNKHQKLPVGSLLVLDWGGLELGFVSFQPRFDDKYLVSYGQSVPTPPDPTTYVEAIRIPVYVSDIGLLQWLISSEIVLNASRLWYETFGYHAEAQQGKLPVYEIGESKPLEITGRTETFYRPTLDIVGWIDREQGQFGPVRVPPPPPILPNAAPPIALPPAPANDEAATYRPIATPAAAPTPAPRETPKPANDLLAAFRKRNF